MENYEQIKMTFSLMSNNLREISWEEEEEELTWGQKTKPKLLNC